MATAIREINSRWISYEPEDADVTFNTVGNEAQIRWGTAIEGGKSGLGHGGTSPPLQDVPIGEEFVLGILRHFNQPITGTFLTSATLEITIVFDTDEEVVFTLELVIDETPNDEGPPASDDTISVASTFPIEIEQDGISLTIVGLKDPVGDVMVDELVSPEDATNSVQLICKLVETPQEEEHCVEDTFTPVFDPARCSIPPVCPISLEAIIGDCGIPDAPEPIIDFPEIDIPTFVGLAGAGNDGTPGEPGPPGPPGPPGEGGDEGCTPEITVNYSVIYTTCEIPFVTVRQYFSPPCDTYIHITFYFCKPYYQESACCIYKCCDGHYELIEGGFHCYEQGQTSTTTLEPGDPGPIYPPEDAACEIEGGTITICPCETTPPPECVESNCCGDSVEECGTVAVTFPSVCTNPCSYESEACFDGSTYWVAESSDCEGSKIEIFCSPGQEEDGDWTAFLTCRGKTVEADGGCTDQDNGYIEVIFEFDPDGLAGDLDDCCPQASQNTEDDPIIVVFTVKKCEPTTIETTQPPPDTTSSSTTTTTTTTPDPCSALCIWQWNDPPGEWVLLTPTACPGCLCLIPPDYDGAFDGETAFTSASCF